MHFTSQDCKKVKYKGTSKIGTLMPCRVIRSAAVVISSLNLHQSNLSFFFFLLAVRWRQRRKNVDRCRAVSHAALRDDSGHGCESEVKAITSWVAPLSDLWPLASQHSVCLFSATLPSWNRIPVWQQVLGSLHVFCLKKTQPKAESPQILRNLFYFNKPFNLFF